MFQITNCQTGVSLSSPSCITLLGLVQAWEPTGMLHSYSYWFAGLFTNTQHNGMRKSRIHVKVKLEVLALKNAKPGIIKMKEHAFVC